MLLSNQTAVFAIRPNERINQTAFKKLIKTEPKKGLGKFDVMTSCFICLPQDIFGHLANHFLDDVDQNKKVFRFPYDWQNLMSTSKKYFGQWKKKVN
jgi:hypothetical protein